MSSKVEFTCNFCGDRIADQSINPDYMAFCFINPDGNNFQASTRLFDRLDGPHICYQCVTNILKRYGAYFEEFQNGDL